MDGWMDGRWMGGKKDGWVVCMRVWVSECGMKYVQKTWEKDIIE